jgi:imidazolonepropionase-like amidohydrolase
MKKERFLKLLMPLILVSFLTTNPAWVFGMDKKSDSILLHAARVFDGKKFRTNTSVTIVDGKVEKIGPRSSFESNYSKIIDLGDATLLPGFIELHAHLSFRKIPANTVLMHGITTIRDVGGPVHKPFGGKGSLRVLTSGRTITAPNGYPIPNMGSKNIAIAVSTEKEARKTVRNLIEAGAVVIKVTLEPGGEVGAPWSTPHSHGHHNHGHHKAAKKIHSHTETASKKSWPLLPENIVKAIVNEAHKNNRKVTAHVAEEKGVRIAINSGIDEWAHVPCNAIPISLLKKAVSQKVKIVSTLDTLSKCSGLAENAATWTSLGGELLYGAEIAHPDIPWGIDAQELMYLKQMGKMDLINILQAATSKAGSHINIPLLGTLQVEAPADIIAVKGDPTKSLKILEYPDLVISGGKIVKNNF